MIAAIIALRRSNCKNFHRRLPPDVINLIRCRHCNLRATPNQKHIALLCAKSIFSRSIPWGSFWYMHNDGHSCFPRGSVENYADGKFPLSDDRAPLPFHHHDVLSRPTRWRREDFSFACQKRQNQTFPYRTDHGAKYLPGKPARARPLMHNALSVPYSNIIERMVQTGQEGILRFRAVRFYAQSAGRNIVCTCANTKLLDRGLN